MENEEIMIYEENEEVKTKKGSKLWLGLLIGGVTALAGAFAYKKVIKPKIDKKRAEKEEIYVEVEDDSDVVED